MAPESGETSSGLSRRSALVRQEALGGLVVVVVLLVVAGAVAFLGERDVTSANQGHQGVPVTRPPLQRCVENTIDFLSANAEARNAGDEYFIFRRYGAEDPRTSALITVYDTFQAEALQYGEREARRRSFNRVADYCLEHELR